MQLSGAGVRGVTVDREREEGGGSLPLLLSLVEMERRLRLRPTGPVLRASKGQREGRGVCVWERERARERRWQLCKFELDWDSMQNEREDKSCLNCKRFFTQFEKISKKKKKKKKIAPVEPGPLACLRTWCALFPGLDKNQGILKQGNLCESSLSS